MQLRQSVNKKLKIFERKLYYSHNFEKSDTWKKLEYRNYEFIHKKQSINFRALFQSNC